MALMNNKFFIYNLLTLNYIKKNIKNTKYHIKSNYNRYK
ncbi:Uncharacterised protein [Yersinia enterocolitica]|uniref:Uncharacterized protein n=3 Tax=Yersinia enterocolitica TaxID=630 RepID=A0A0E1NFY4_YEREN|nr:hypothetical protein CH48_947 [Yersinia enterocolitica]EOR65108.1 hypothetical protein YE150_18833 [Yersinia enterocolitica subsp. palearctica YE-150]CBX69651.1 unknown protein [Yersinia enterocolitica W22703]CBY28643.1 hypothetical protein Y11_38871 [Yersinia enterocolitica subsp. palearctica Y11]CCO70517.1 hypothetical protein D322_3665 [Yersinia enterocolitica IP 10393]VEA98351.1 Uncharacterised protein [Yersinia enterocolitica subsp. enterocolitica]VEF82980.1 Uncharacterised protein [Y